MTWGRGPFSYLGVRTVRDFHFPGGIRRLVKGMKGGRQGSWELVTGQNRYCLSVTLKREGAKGVGEKKPERTGECF